MRQEWSPPAPGCVKNASRMVLPAPSRMCEKCVKNGPPSPRMCEKCVKNGPPSPRSAKTATRLVHQCFAIFTQTRVVRKLRQDWSTSVVAIFAQNGPLLLQFSHMGGPVLLHFSHVRKLQQHWGDQSCRSFRANQVVRKLQQDWSHQCCCNFRTCEKCNNTGPPMCENCNNNGPFCAKIATTLVQMREKCNNNGSICAKTVSTPVPHARKVQQHWGQNVRKVCQGLNTIGIYGLGFRV